MLLAGKMVLLGRISNSPAPFLVAVVISAHQATVTSTVRRATVARKLAFRLLTASIYIYIYTMFRASDSNKAFQIAVGIPEALVQISARARVELRRIPLRKHKIAKPLAFRTAVLFRTQVFG